MKHAGPAALSLCLALASSPALGAPVFNAPADVKAINAIEKILSYSLNIDQILPFYTPGTVIYDAPLHGTYYGRAGAKSGYEPQLKALKYVTGIIQDYNVISDGTMACALVQTHNAGALQNGTPFAVSIRQMDIFRKINGTWQIEFEHISYPVNAKTGMAVLDGQITPAGPLSFSGNPLPGPRITDAAARAGIRAWTTQFAVAATVPDFLKTVGPEDDIIIYDLFAPGALRGQKVISGTYGPGFAGLASTKVKFTQFYEDSDGYLGAQMDTQKLAIKLKNGSTLNWEIRQSDCLHNVGGKWYSMLDELSFPADMTTGKAVMTGY